MRCLRGHTRAIGDNSRCRRRPSLFQSRDRQRIGIDYDEPRFQPIVLKDRDGAPHTFLIRSILVPTGHELEAVEKTESDRPGYRFAVLGDFEAEPWELFSGSSPAYVTRSQRDTSGARCSAGS
jgi:hypothetical protein